MKFPPSDQYCGQLMIFLTYMLHSVLSHLDMNPNQICFRHEFGLIKKKLIKFYKKRIDLIDLKSYS